MEIFFCGGQKSSYLPEPIGADGVQGPVLLSDMSYSD